MLGLLILPFIKIILLIGFVLFWIEKLIYIFLVVPFLWLFTTIDVEEFVDNFSIIVWIGEHWFSPFCEKCGIEIYRI